jgi:hypothetical protein
MKKNILYTHLLNSKSSYFFLIILFIISLMIITLFSDSIPDNNIKEQTFTWLNKIKQLKKNEVIDYFSEIKNTALKTKQDKTILYAFEALNNEKNNPELELEIDKHYIKNYSSFYDILFVNKNGYVFHSIKKESDYQKNVFAPNHSSLHWSNSLNKQTNEQFIEFEYYSPSDEAAAFFTITLKKNRQPIGWIVLQFSTNKINKILTERQELGRTGEVYLVNKKHLMLTDSRFTEDSTILRQKVDTDVIKDAFRFSEGEKIMQDYRDVVVFSSFEKFELMGIQWVIVVEVDEDEVISNHYKKYKQYFQREILQYLATQQTATVTTSKVAPSLKRVDINEFFKADATGGLMTLGVSTCTSIAISYPGKFAYLAHITPTDEIYINSSLTQFFLGKHYQNIFSQLLDKIKHYDIYAYELKQLQIVIAAPHDESFIRAIDILLEHQIELSQIKLMYIPKARSINVTLKEAGKILDVTWRQNINIVGENMQKIDTLGAIVKKISRYDKKAA